MPKEIYRKLARGLDAIPPGLPPTESGVELRLLEKYFSRAEGEVPLPPIDADEWMVQRAAARDTPGGVAIVHGGVRKCRLLGRD